MSDQPKSKFETSAIYQLSGEDLNSMIDRIVEETTLRAIEQNQKPKFFAVKEVAIMLSMHENTVRKSIKMGKLKGTKIGPRRIVVSAKDLDDFTSNTLE